MSVIPSWSYQMTRSYVHATFGFLSKGHYFSELHSFSVTDCITLTQILWSYS